jgi:hypothetical protein
LVGEVRVQEGAKRRKRGGGVDEENVGEEAERRGRREGPAGGSRRRSRAFPCRAVQTPPRCLAKVGASVLRNARQC